MIYINGDSHSYGYGLDSNKRFGNLVAEHFDQKCINQSLIGASNDYILRTSRRYLQKFRPNLVIIGWSTWEREEWEHQGQYYNVNSSGYNSLPVELQDRYKIWIADQNETSLQIKSDHWHREIWQWHCELKQKNISHVFFNCMYNFFNAQPQDWNRCYIEPYQNDYSYYWYLKKRGYQTDECYHYRADGHACWAEFLIKYIKENQLL